MNETKYQVLQTLNSMKFGIWTPTLMMTKNSNFNGFESYC